VTGIADATSIITRAMEETGVDRLVFLSAFGVGARSARRRCRSR
jgi:hypothetical protein